MKAQKLLLSSLVFWFAQSCLFAQVSVDTTYVHRVYCPAFSGLQKPQIRIDGAHNNLHRRSGNFAPLAKLLQSDGFEITDNNAPFDRPEALKNCDVLVIANALHASNRGNWTHPTPSAFAQPEIAALEHWVRSGGSLLLIADHMPFSGAAQDLARAFGVEWLDGFVGAETKAWPPNVFSAGKKTLYALENQPLPVETVATFCGSAFKAPPSARSLLSLTQKDTLVATDTAWVFRPGSKKKSLDGYSQGAVFRYGKGKVAVFAEAAMFTAQIITANNTKVGFSSPAAPDNAHFIQNLFYWLLPNPAAFDPGFAKNIEKQKTLEAYKEEMYAEARNALKTTAGIYIPDKDGNLERLKAINRDIWTPFSEAYAANDAEKYLALHTPDFIRANGGAWAGTRNLSEYGKSVRSSFAAQREKGAKVQIDFTFFERAAGPETASERGVYRYTSIQKDGTRQVFYGQFHVFHRLVNGVWKIAVDYDSDEDHTVGEDDFNRGLAPHIFTKN